MSLDANKYLAESYLSAFNKQDLDALEQIIDPALMTCVSDYLSHWVTTTYGQYYVEITHCAVEESLISLRVLCVGSKIDQRICASSAMRRWRMYGSMWMHVGDNKIDNIEELWGIPHFLDQSKTDTRKCQSSFYLPILIQPPGDIYVY